MTDIKKDIKDIKDINFDEVSPITDNKCVVVEADPKTNIQSYMCMESGYTTTDSMTIDSDVVKNFESKLTGLMKDAKFIDTERNLIWYPAFMSVSSTMLYCIGNSPESLKYQVAKVVPILGEERLKYPIPGKEGEYHTTRLDVDNANTYDKLDFKKALDEFFLNIKEAYDNENKLRNNSMQ
jgi:hypothetical protein